MNFYTTKKFCDDLGYRLPLPRNQAENNALRDATSDKNFFIGIARRMGEGGKLKEPNRWINQYTKSEYGFRNWAVDVHQYIMDGTDMSNMKVGVFLKVI